MKKNKERSSVRKHSSIMQRIVTCCVRGYQLIISPLLPPCCRFTPSCSQYALEAVNMLGVRRGLYYAVKRLLRCHPFHPGGYDPIDCRLHKKR